MSPRYILVCCILIHTQALVRNGWAISGTHKEEQRLLAIFQGITFLLYPVSGWLAEVCFGTFRMIRCSFIIMTLGSSLMALNGILVMTNDIEVDSKDEIYTSLSIISIITVLIGLGMFEANAIQSALEEMLDASSDRLSSFIHWYFWCCHLGPLVVLYSVLGGVYYMFQCQIDEDLLQPYYFGTAIVFLSVMPIPVFLFGFIITTKAKSSTTTEQAKRNSLKIIFKVLKYSYQHKYPERRSAFTYWENDTPSRIDLGKEKYGGPFTYEQVEDVKTFFRLLLLILSLFGYHLLGEGYSLSYYIMNTFGCPTTVSFLFNIGNPKHFLLLVVLIGIPLSQCFKKYFHHFAPNMLTRLCYGLVLSLLTETLQILYSVIIDRKKDFSCLQAQEHNLLVGHSMIMKCLVANLKLLRNETCVYLCTDHPIGENLYIVYLSIIPFTLYGISYLLIFMTTLEFICAQSPNSTKGLLIGIWYSMLSIKYMINALDIYEPLIEIIPWNIYNGTKGIGIFLSIGIFTLVRKGYRYRERNEIVNEQAIIEEQYERELLNNSNSTFSFNNS